MLAVVLLGALPAGAEVVEVGTFSAMVPGDALPGGWRPLHFPRIARHTAYTLVVEDGVTVLRAVSERAASALYREVEIEPARYPIVRWRWKVANLIAGGDVHRRAGDDYPARLYVSFAYDAATMGLARRLRYQAARLLFGEAPAGVLNYIWERATPPGTIVPNAYTDFARMLVVESGPQRVGTWVDERRNIVEDHRRAFGEEPSRVTGVAVMTDTDDTGERATAFYGDIAFEAAP